MITQVRERALFLMERPTARAAMCRGLPTMIDGQGYRMVEASDNPQKLGYDLRKVGLTPALSEQQRADLKSAAENGQRLWTGASGVSTGVPVVDADSCIIAGDPGNLSTVGQPEQRHGRWEPLGAGRKAGGTYGMTSLEWAGGFRTDKEDWRQYGPLRDRHKFMTLTEVEDHRDEMHFEAEGMLDLLTIWAAGLGDELDAWTVKQNAREMKYEDNKTAEVENKKAEEEMERLVERAERILADRDERVLDEMKRQVAAERVEAQARRDERREEFRRLNRDGLSYSQIGALQDPPISKQMVAKVIQGPSRNVLPESEKATA